MRCTDICKNHFIFSDEIKIHFQNFTYSYTSNPLSVNIRICQANDADVQKFDSDVTHNHENFLNQKTSLLHYLLEVIFKKVLCQNVR